MSHIKVIGCGPGARSLITLEAYEAIAESDIIIGADRLIEAFGESKKCICYHNVNDTISEIRKNVSRKTALLVTGDPGFFSLTKRVLKEFGSENVHIISGISSVTYFFNKIGIPWEDAKFVSCHSRLEDEIGSTIRKNKKVGILTSEKNSVKEIVKVLDDDLLKNYKFLVGERLSYKDEMISSPDVDKLKSQKRNTLTVLLAIRKDYE